MEGDFEVAVVESGSGYSDIVVRSRKPEGLPAYSPAFIQEVICAARTDLGIDAVKAEFEGPESEGLAKIRARVYHR